MSTSVRAMSELTPTDGDVLVITLPAYLGIPNNVRMASIRPDGAIVDNAGNDICAEYGETPLAWMPTPFTQEELTRITRKECLPSP